MRPTARRFCPTRRSPTSQQAPYPVMPDRLVVGCLGGAPVCVMQGRFHFYEGYSLQQVTLPCACDAAHGRAHADPHQRGRRCEPAPSSIGDLMLIEDHINFVGMAGHNPLSGPNLDEFGPRFPGANHIYTQAPAPDRRPGGARSSASTCNVASIPCSPAPTSKRRLKFACCALLGTDAVGMSTVPEALIAHHAGMDVLAISTITNVTIDELDADTEPTHEEVKAAGTSSSPSSRAPSRHHRTDRSLTAALLVRQRIAYGQIRGIPSRAAGSPALDTPARSPANTPAPARQTCSERQLCKRHAHGAAHQPAHRLRQHSAPTHEITPIATPSDHEDEQDRVRRCADGAHHANLPRALQYVDAHRAHQPHGARPSPSGRP